LGEELFPWQDSLNLCGTKIQEVKAMKIKYLGHSCFLITAGDGTKIITDPYEPGGFDGAIKYGALTEPADVVIVSHQHADHNYIQGVPGDPVLVSAEGLQAAHGIEFKGVGSFHDASQGKERGLNTVFTFTVDGVTITHLGDLGHLLSDEQLAQLGKVDLLLIPVGGFFTIDAAQATGIIDQLKPVMIIPMHSKTPKIDLPIAPVDDFLAGKERVGRTGGSEIEITAESLPAQTEIVVLEPAL